MRLHLAIGFVLTLLAAPVARAADQAIIVLDASGSMWGQIDGEAKMSIARKTLDSVLSKLPADQVLGLMVYGHREKGSCSDIELAVPPASGTAPAISTFVKTINPKGKTPLSAAVRQAAEALKYTEEKATVILVTDGLETCEADPCALASELEKTGVDFTAHVVGFGLTQEEGKQVACLAENTGGKYLQAKDAGELSKALRETVAAVPPPKPAPEPATPAVEFNVETDAVLSEGGPSLGKTNDVNWQFYKANADGEPDGDYLDNQYVAAYATNLPAGKYVAVATLENAIKKTLPFEVIDGKVAKLFVNFDAAHLVITPKRTPQDTAADDAARIDVMFGEFTPTFYGKTHLYVAAGPVTITGSLGAAVAEQTITAEAGQMIDMDLVIASGVVVNRAIYGTGAGDVDSGEVFFEVVSPKQDINGDRKSFANTYGTGTKLDTPTGELVLTARLGSARGETAFSIGAGERKDVTVDLNAGVLAVLSPDADRIVVNDAKKDIQGNAREVSYGFGPELKDTLPAGDYVVTVTFKGDTAPQEHKVTIKAGERTEISAK
ncbi:MAG: vWA domain-containing protein [Allorhizobium sp.]